VQLAEAIQQFQRAPLEKKKEYLYRVLFVAGLMETMLIKLKYKYLENIHVMAMQMKTQIEKMPVQDVRQAERFIDSVFNPLEDIIKKTDDEMLSGFAHMKALIRVCRHKRNAIDDLKKQSKKAAQKNHKALVHQLKKASADDNYRVQEKRRAA